MSIAHVIILILYIPLNFIKMNKFTIVIEPTLGRISVPTYNSFDVGTLLGR